jgi:hypothetical protein
MQTPSEIKELRRKSNETMASARKAFGLSKRSEPARNAKPELIGRIFDFSLAFIRSGGLELEDAVGYGRSMRRIEQISF